MNLLEQDRRLAASRAYQDSGTVDNEKGEGALDREALVKRYSPLVLRIAKRVRRRTGYAVELDDLVCEGVIGLLQASERFDPARETDFEHLASVRVQGAMLDSLRRLDPLSQRRRRTARHFRDTREKLLGVLGQEPNSEEMAQALGMDLDQYHRLSHELAAAPPISVEDMSLELRSTSPLQEKTVQLLEVSEHLKEVINTLPEKQQKVLSLIYFDELSQKEVSDVLNVTEARISQIHKEALARLRKRMITRARPDEDAW
jgi:RNA polymerase sigma factor for flagellar operon FliA